MKLPAKFGDYYLFERIAVGGMAEVFKAASYGVEAFERLVAVKRVLPSISEDQEFIDMFIDEAKIAVQLSHANIGQVFELGNADGRYFIAMEFVSGMDARAVFDRSRSLGTKLDVAMCCHIVKEVCEALEYAHNKNNDRGEPLNLIHRDVSPQNILVSFEGEVKLIDFGIAKAAGKANKTQSGILKGKFGYMSPEQVRGKPIDKRSDLFSLGTVLYELLTGERCFQGPDDFSILEKVRKVDFRRPTLLNRMIPPELERIIYRSLTRNPDDRFQSAAAFKDELQKFLYQSGSFYSRKELSDYMRETFNRELKDSQTRTENFRAYARKNIVAARRPGSVSGVDDDFSEADIIASGAEGNDLVDRSTEEDPPSRLREAAKQNQGRLVGTDVSSQMKTLPLGTNQVPIGTSEPTRRLFWLVLIALFAIVAGILVIFRFVDFLEPKQVHLITDPPRVSVFLNGQFRYEGLTPIELKNIRPGEENFLVVKAKNHQSLHRKLEFNESAELRLNLKLTPSKPATQLNIETTPSDATVFLDDKRVSNTPLKLDSIRSGNVRLRIEKPGYLVWNGTLDIQESRVNQKSIALHPAKITVSFISEPETTEIKIIDGRGTITPVPNGSDRMVKIPNLGDSKFTVMAPGYRSITKNIPKLFDPEHTEFVSLERVEVPTRRPVSQKPVPVPVEAVPSKRPKEKPRRRSNRRRQPPQRSASSRSLPPVNTVQVIQGAVEKPGFLKLLAQPPAIASVNGKRLGWTPILRHPLGAGRHAILLVRETEPQYRESLIVEIKPGQTSFIRHVHRPGGR